MAQQPQKLDPRSSMYLRGFDRRGAAASIHDVTDNGFTLSGVFSDQADFAVLVLYDEDDLYGHLTTSKYLPDSSLIGMKLDFDYAASGLMPLESYKFASVAWNQLSFIKANGASGAYFLQPLLTNATGMVAATGQWQVMGVPATFLPTSAVYLWYLNLNIVFPPPGAFPPFGVGSFTPSNIDITAGVTVFSNGAGSVHTCAVISSTFNPSTQNVYTYTEQSGDGSHDVAVGLMDAVNGVVHTGSSTNGPDPLVQASAPGGFPNFVVTPRVDTGQVVQILTDKILPNPALDNLILSLGTYNHGIALNLAAQINNFQWATSVQPTTALMGQASGDSLIVTAARYGTANLNGSSLSVLNPSTFVALTPNQNFLGSNVGDPIIINGSGGFSITSVTDPNTVSITPSGPSGVTGVYLAPGAGVDGNSIELYEQHNDVNLFLSPSGSLKLVGGHQATNLHMQLDFTGLTLDSTRQSWFTLAPNLQYNSVQGSTGTLVPFTPSEFQAIYSNWTVTDPNGIRPLKIAGSGSQIVDSRQTDSWVQYQGQWISQAGFFHHGFASASHATGDLVRVKYGSGYTHNLYLGTALYLDRGIFEVTLDGVAKPDLDCYLDVSSQLLARRLIASGVGPGVHHLTLRIKGKNILSAGNTCYFDYIHAVANPGPAILPTGLSPSGVPPTGGIYPNFAAACDFDTDQTYKVAPERLQYVMQQLGFKGDIDFFAGVFFALKRKRFGGFFHTAQVTVSGAWNQGDAAFLNFGGFPPIATGGSLPPGQPTGGTNVGKSIINPALDTNAVIANHLAYFINETFVAVWAIVGGASGNVITIQGLSPINGSSLYAYTAGSGTGTNSASGALVLTGDVQTGNEGVWGVDGSQTSPLNRAFVDYLSAWSRALAASGQSTTVAFSQELLVPPDVNTASGAWSQRYNDGTPVLTATSFGSWGAGVVEAVSGTGPGVVTIQETANGYITGNTAHFAGFLGSAVYTVTIVDANNYQVTVPVGGYTPHVGDNVFIDLQTSQCTFNPATFGTYITNCYIQTAQIMKANGLVPWIQLGEVGWWFFSSFGTGISNVVASVSPSGTQITTTAPNPFSTGDQVIIGGVRGCVGNGTWPITVLDSSNFVIPVTFKGTYIPGGFPQGGVVNGGSQAYYDAYTKALATLILGRALNVFTCQDSDPSINSFADANFLRTELYTHMHAVASGVKAAVSGTMIEWLLPLDVDNPTVYSNFGFPFAQGGRMNNYVNIPTQYMSATGTDLDRLKMEALSWGATYRFLQGAKNTIQYPYTTLTWPKSKVFYLIPIFNGSCPWPAEYLFWLTQNLPGFNFWALDHVILLSWDVPLPLPGNGAIHS